VDVGEAVGRRCHQPILAELRPSGEKKTVPLPKARRTGKSGAESGERDRSRPLRLPGLQPQRKVLG
jgi:hypothetical protein